MVNKSKWLKLLFNYAIWNLSAENKTETAIKIPIAESAMVILKDIFSKQVDQSEYLFPALSVRKTKSGHINATYVNKLIKNKIIPLMGDVENFTIHDFRHTMKSNMSELGVQHFISERCLNHKVSGMAGIYDNYDYLQERTRVMTLWANRVDACETGESLEITNVIPFKKTA